MRKAHKIKVYQCEYTPGWNAQFDDIGDAQSFGHGDTIDEAIYDLVYGGASNDIVEKIVIDMIKEHCITPVYLNKLYK